MEVGLRQNSPKRNHLSEEWDATRSPQITQKMRDACVILRARANRAQKGAVTSGMARHSAALSAL
jgi:hypothetical protein